MKNIIFPETVISGWYDSRKSHYRGLSSSPHRQVCRFELELPVGDGGIPYINGVRPPSGSGFVVCAKPGDTRYTRLPYQCYYIHLVVSEGELYRRLMELPSFISIDEEKIFLDFFSGEEFFGSLDDDLHCAARILEGVRLLSLQSRKVDMGSQGMERICSYIRNHPENDLSLKTLAESAGFSSSYFHSLFKKYTGMTLREYVEEQRLRKAIALLITTEKTLVEIAYDCGFSSQSYFNYVFKKKMKLTPREYIKGYCNQYED